MTQVCPVCFVHCSIPEGAYGRCKARVNKNGRIVSAGYGQLTSLALDPIEKKPLKLFYPGSVILSAGSYGCNLRCPFCQNHTISMESPQNNGLSPHLEYWAPERLVSTASELKKSRGNIGIAFTYNEPLINLEYIFDVSVLSHKNDLKNVVVTNGSVECDIIKPILPYIDAMNIDLKGFTKEYYRDFLKGSLEYVMDFIKLAIKYCHVELTTLIIPGKNDSDEEMRRMCEWIASLDNGSKIPLHISRFFPSYKMSNASPTPISKVYHLKDVASEYLDHVFTGNC